MRPVLDCAALDFAGQGQTTVHSIPSKPQKTCDSSSDPLMNSHVKSWGGALSKEILLQLPTFDLLTPSLRG